MSALAEITLRTAVPVLVGLLGCSFLRRRSAALRHTVLTGALAASLAVVPLSWVIPSWRVPVLTAPAAPLVDEVLLSPGGLQRARLGSQSGSRGDGGRQLPVVLWASGVLIAGGFLVRGGTRLARLTRRARPIVGESWNLLVREIGAVVGLQRAVTLLLTDTPDTIATWGVVRPRVLLPAGAIDWAPARARAVLAHELAHVRRWDWAVQMAAALLRAVFWFNPLLWLLEARLRREAEQACDDVAIRTGISASEYASQLVDIARACRPSPGWTPAMSMARSSTLEGRVTAMFNTSIDRRVPGRWLKLAVAGAVVGVSCATASLQPSAQEANARDVTGVVYDVSGGVLPGVEVALVGGADRRSAVTDGSGRFSFGSVAPGGYVLEAALPGFRTLRNEVRLAGDAYARRTITLQVGELQETVTVTAKRPVQETAPPGAASAPVRVGGNIRVPRKLTHVNPVYPTSMREAALEAIVPMEAVIGVDGRVVSLRVLTAEVHPEFARAAEDAVRQWTFSPTLLNNRPVEVQMTVSVQFSLED